MAKVTSLPQPPYQFAFVDKSGMLTDAWSKWILQLYDRIGGASAIANANATLFPSVAIINQFAINSDLTLYTSPAGQSTIVDSFNVINKDAVAQTISIYVIPIGQFKADQYLIVNAQSVQAGQTQAINALKNFVIPSGSYLLASASANSVLLVQASGRQVS